MNLRFAKTYDVAVLGGGVAGVAAALAAARHGRRVALIEKTVFWGGLATSGMIVIYLPLCDGNGNQVTFGISEELLKASLKYGPGEIPGGWRNGEKLAEEKRYRVVFSPASFVLSLEEKLREAGVDLWMDTQAIDVELDHSRLVSLVVANKSGCGVIDAAQFIDASGDADLAAFSGAETVTAANALAYWAIQRRPGSVGDSIGGADVYGPGVGLRAWGYADAPNCTRSGIDGKTVSDFVCAGREAYRRELREAYARGVSRKELFPLTIPAMAQLRHTRRIAGRETLDSNMEWKSFSDSIGMVADWRCTGKVWEVPYRALLPLSLDNVLAAGRCISSGNDAWEVTRVIQAAALTGEAAGTAAALAIPHRIPAAELPVAELQNALRQTGNKLHFDDVFKK